MKIKKHDRQNKKAIVTARVSEKDLEALKSNNVNISLLIRDTLAQAAKKLARSA